MVIEGDSISRAAKVAGMDTSYLNNLVSQYKNGGITQLLTQNKHYTAEFKKKVIEYRWEHGLSFNQITTLFKIPSRETS